MEGQSGDQWKSDGVKNRSPIGMKTFCIDGWNPVVYDIETVEKNEEDGCDQSQAIIFNQPCRKQPPICDHDMGEGSTHLIREMG
jgi:hypothetical protein